MKKRKNVQKIILMGLVSMGLFWGLVLKSEALRTPVPLIPSNFSQLAKEVSPSVVNIATSKTSSSGMSQFRHPPGQGYQEWEEFFEKFFGDQNSGGEQKLKSLGSGFIWSKDGYIVTNYHVVANTKDIQVQLSDKKQYPAKIIGLDKKTDLALIKIQVKEDLPEVTLGNSEELEIGNWVVAIGNAFGLSHTVTAGIVSAKGRMINLGPYDDFIQTDASINPGNSGGPLFNLNGEVVGINSAIVASGQGIGFAIPINMAKNLIPQLKTHGKVVRGWLGVLVQKVSPELAGAFKLKNPEGALVAQVMEGSPAQKAGIIQGDIILKFSGHKIVEMTDLPRLVANTPVGKKVPIDIYRNNKNKQIMITIEKLEDESEVLALPKPEEMEKNDVYGLYLDDLTSDISRQLKMKNSKGVLVKEIEPNSPASESEFRRGDVITEINQIPIGNLNELKKVVEKNAKKDVLLMLVLRDGIAYYVTLKKKG